VYFVLESSGCHLLLEDAVWFRLIGPSKFRSFVLCRCQIRARIAFRLWLTLGGARRRQSSRIPDSPVFGMVNLTLNPVVVVNSISEPEMSIAFVSAGRRKHHSKT
jgi:hypothetical protein